MSRFRTLLGITGLALVHGALAFAGLQFAKIGGAISPVWPATGVAIAVMLLLGRQLWPAVFIGTFVAHSVAVPPEPILVRLIFAVANSVGIYVSVALLENYKGFDRRLRRVADVLFLSASGLGAGVVSGAISIPGVVLLGWLAPSDAGDAFANWVSGGVVGVALFSPLVLTWARPEPLPRAKAWWGGFAGLLGGAILISWATFVSPVPGLRLLTWHVVPLFVASALLLDARAATTICTVALGLALYGVEFGAGIFAQLENVRLFGAQQYAAIMAITTTLLAVMVEALRRARQAVENEPRYQRSAENETRLLLAQEAGQVGTWEWRVGHDTAICNASCLKIFGLQEEKRTISLDEWRSNIHPEDRDRALSDLQRASEGASVYSSKYRIFTPEGVVRHVDSRAKLFDYPEKRLVGVVIDITEIKEAEARTKLLMREVDHRAKNALAVVQAVVRLTRAENKGDFAAAVEGRIKAIARAHELLAKSRWSGASLRKLLEEEASPYGERVHIQGADITLSPDTAQPMSLVLHELFTNAAKYGALSTPEGTIEINLATMDSDDRLCVRWTEAGGPRVVQPASAGLGTNIMNTSIKRQLNGAIQFDWRDTGLAVEIEIPFARLAGDPTARARTTNHDGAVKVMLVEDDAMIGLDMSGAVQGLGYEITGPFKSVGEALGALEQGLPAAALLDVRLDGEWSIPIAQKLAELHVPFAFCTGYGGFEAEAAKYGAPVLAKPLAREEIKRTLNVLLTPQS